MSKGFEGWVLQKDRRTRSDIGYGELWRNPKTRKHEKEEEKSSVEAMMNHNMIIDDDDDDGWRSRVEVFKRLLL